MSDQFMRITMSAWDVYNRLDKARDRISKLEAALEPFADEAGDLDLRNISDDGTVLLAMRVGDLRNARELLQQMEEAS